MLASELPISLSAAAQKVLKEVEGLYGDEVRFEEDPELCGRMMVKPNLPYPTIYCKKTSSVTEQDLVHELLHLKYRKLGYPYLMPKDSASEEIKTIATVVNGLFDHAIIFSQLVNMGYNPFAEEEEPVRKQLDKLLAEGPSLNCEDIVARAKFSALYARVRMDCQSQEIKKMCNELFLAKESDLCRETGKNLIEVVRRYAAGGVDSFENGLEKTVEMLGLRDSVEIRRARNQ